MSQVLTKWIEPYVLLETLKKDCELVKVYHFDAFSKNGCKKELINATEKENFFGLYMKNVNMFYLFKGSPNLEQILTLSPNDVEKNLDVNTVIQKVDLGKAEAGFINI